jgi:3',5'-cyclic AMP phosphodiesterase CpdA
MKILHTADWHMNNTLGRIDLTAHIVDALAQIAEILETHRVDVMIVAGDLFSERSRPEQMRGAVGTIRRLFLPFLARGGTIVAIAGNHDSEVFFETLRDALQLAAPSSDAVGTTSSYRYARNSAIARFGGNRSPVRPHALPHAALLLERRSHYRTLAEKHRRVQEAFSARCTNFRDNSTRACPAFWSATFTFAARRATRFKNQRSRRSRLQPNPDSHPLGLCGIRTHSQTWRSGHGRSARSLLWQRGAP